ncbi:hypothetical protein NW762_009752 [Fusarium torreyae]|uniref:Uncharacterized protein n=1 Tax=Fusarium torreyae TaxID=1237075 RepID=A0A9W8RUY1_9HYPO|nr:hypothetical protein NW762_009752 [Fusarium torreyae]
MPNPLKAILATYHFLAWALDHDQVPNDIRRSLELVRTCDADLQHLIELRNECLPLLKRRPKVLQRVHSIIEAAQKGLEEVCEIVERCRPEAHQGGKTPLSSCMAWVLVDASEFRSQEPIVSQHHAAVLAELNFLRQIALLVPISEPVKVQEKRGVQRDAVVFDNVALLGDILGDFTVPVKKEKEVLSPIAPAPPIIVLNATPEPIVPSDMSSLSVPSSLKKSASSQTLHIEHSLDSLPEVLPVDMVNMAPSTSHTTSSKLDSDGLAGLALLLGDPLDWQKSPSPTPTLQVDVPNRPVTVPNHALNTGLPRPQPVFKDSDQHLPPRHNDTVSDLGQHDRHMSTIHTPSVLSSKAPNLHPNHRSSLSTLPIMTRTITQQQNVSSTTVGQYTWTNTSFTTVSSVSPAISGSDLLFKSSTWVHPIAELDTSPFQMIPIADALDQVVPAGDESKERQLTLQINENPVELPAEDSLAVKAGLRRQATHLRSSRRGRALSQPASSSSQQLKPQSFPENSSNDETQGIEAQP